ncbi:MAG: HNH endonuclease domain-containing protein [Marinifilaceae bacterium]
METFINGENSIVFPWVDFSYKLMKNDTLSKSELYTVINTDYETNRTTTEATIFFTQRLNNADIKCVWSGKKITTDLHIDHIIPFPLSKNKGLGNLLPSKAKVNGSKSDRIPK